VADDEVARKADVSATESRPVPGKRRSFTAAEKLRIVREAAACTERGGIEALLRREGIYSSLLSSWRKQLDLRGSEALAVRKPGRKPKLDAKDRRILELERRTARLEAKLALADKLIALQKKASELLGVELATDEES
jgi:transposase-like protein